MHTRWTGENLEDSRRVCPQTERHLPKRNSLWNNHRAFVSTIGNIFFIVKDIAFFYPSSFQEFLLPCPTSKLPSSKSAWVAASKHTNIVEPVLSVITDIDLDHQKFLGNTIAEIAREKAGILRPRIPAVILPQHPEANQVLGERISELGARAVNAARNVAPLSPQSSNLVKTSPLETRFQLRYWAAGGDRLASRRSPSTPQPSARHHRCRRTGRAGLPHHPAEHRRGARQTCWPGRFQRFAATLVAAGGHSRRRP